MPCQSIFVSKVLKSYGPQVDCTAPLNGSLLHLPQVMAWTRESAKQLMFSTDLAIEKPPGKVQRTLRGADSSLPRDVDEIMTSNPGDSM